MTSYYRFIPNNKKAPSFTPTFDGIQYNCTIIWNISSLRYFVLCQTMDSQLVFLLPIIESQPAFDLANLEYDDNDQRVIATTINPHGFPIGMVLNMTLINALPIGYNGSGLASIISKNQFVYNMQQNPGQPMVFGSAEFLISMTQGYFQSTLVFRNSTFEVNP
jgi:hypothetical protein